MIDSPENANVNHILSKKSSLQTNGDCSFSMAAQAHKNNFSLQKEEQTFFNIFENIVNCKESTLEEICFCESISGINILGFCACNI